MNCLGLGPALVRAWRLPPPAARVAALLSLLPSPVQAAPEPTLVYTKDVRHAALTAQAGTLEFGVFSASRYAVSERLELSLHPVGLLWWPSLDAKIRWLDAGPFTFSSLHSLAYPSRFLNLVARPGTGGLVDPNAEIPTAFQADLGLLATYRVGPAAWATLHPFVQVGLGGRTPVLEFPFLYQRLAAPAAGHVLGLGGLLEGFIGHAVGYEFSATYVQLPLDDVAGAFAVETLAEARWLVTNASTLPFGIRFSHARFPYGRRSHWFPYLDYRLVW